jgi:hypothetical protein
VIPEQGEERSAGDTGQNYVFVIKKILSCP